MNQDINNKLHNGSRVAVIGGGPAGSFFALYLLLFARRAGILPAVTIYQDRRFEDAGPPGCKGCAGVLSMTVTKNLAELGLKVPDTVIRSRIDHYAVHSPYLSLSISNPEKGVDILSIYRGGGPLLADAGAPVSFDGWLLQEARKAGAEVVSRRVAGIDMEKAPAIVIDSESIPFDVIVLACGVNSKEFRVSGTGYTPPRTTFATMAELMCDFKEIRERIGNAAHAFLIPDSPVLFGSLVPKGPFINVSVMSTGRKSVSVSDFLASDVVRSALPAGCQRVCSCRPRVPMTSARNYFADGFVAVGDAAVSRLYKDGIGSALITARRAADTLVAHGYGKEDFRRYYAPLCKTLKRDNYWGKWLFFMTNRTKNSRVFLFTQHRLIGDEQGNIRGPQPFTRIAWGMFTGAYSYRSMVIEALKPASLFKLFGAFIRECGEMLKPRRSGEKRQLHIGGKKIIILGSGFAGTYALRYLVHALNKNENMETMMLSRENYFLFSPLVHEVALGGIEPRHIAYPIRRITQRDRYNFVQTEVKKIDLENKVVNSTAGDFPYDYLVVALGGITDWSELHATSTSVFTLRTLRDSRLLRDHIIGSLEKASLEKDPEERKRLLTVAVCGGGYIGVQVVTEMRDFIMKNIRKYYRTINPDDVRIMLIESEPRVLAHGDARLSNYAMKRLVRMGIDVRLNSRVASYGDGFIRMESADVIPAGALVWVAGQVASPLVAELPVDKDDSGRVKVGATMEVPGFSGVYAVGDCAHFVNPENGQPIPPRAHTAVRQAKTAAYNILADIHGRQKKAYRYSEGGEFVTLGDSSAMLRIGKVRLYGFLARILWLLAYSLLVTGTYNRMRVMMDWVLSIIFGRHLTYFGYQRE
ncbi:MAG: FAD-dependent oxidoreductase [Dehalococcoidia bacterium]|nr:FAD-dependent oxidoreductase [Dehalococcoidia bacterium]